MQVYLVRLLGSGVFRVQRVEREEALLALSSPTPSPTASKTPEFGAVLGIKAVERKALPLRLNPNKLSCFADMELPFWTACATGG